MKANTYIKGLKKITTLVGFASVSLLVGFPTEVRGEGVLNPHPSIFNEPPYNRAGSRQPSSGSSSDDTTKPGDAGVMSPTGGNNLVALAAANGSFKTLTAALKAADLTETLQGEGPFTVFAPTDEAFAALPPEALKELLKPENKQVLIKILKYHVIPGKVAASDLKTGQVKTVEGSPLTVKVENGRVMVNDAKVIQTDIQASNGIIHVIDKVMLPQDL
jgi:uncharacterized surface protein with fasciclin (FAS1) repeats